MPGRCRARCAGFGGPSRPPSRKPGQAMNDYEPTDTAEIEDELREIRGALVDGTVNLLGPAEPICLPPTATVREAVDRMLAGRQAGVLIVDGQGRLVGIFT